MGSGVNFLSFVAQTMKSASSCFQSLSSMSRRSNPILLMSKLKAMQIPCLWTFSQVPVWKYLCFQSLNSMPQALKYILPLSSMGSGCKAKNLVSGVKAQQQQALKKTTFLAPKFSINEPMELFLGSKHHLLGSKAISLVSRVLAQWILALKQIPLQILLFWWLPSKHCSSKAFPQFLVSKFDTF